MELLIIFNEKEVKIIKEGSITLFRGNSRKAFRELKTIHEKFLKNRCIYSTEALLLRCFQNVIEEISVKDRQKEDIAWDLLEILDDNIVEESAKIEVPCVAIIREKDPNETSFHYIAISQDEETIFKIMVYVIDGKIDINIEKGIIAY